MIGAGDLQRARSFGRLVGVVLVLFGMYQAVRGRAIFGGVLAGVGALLAVLGTRAPAVLVVPSRIWWRFSHALGWINSRLLLTLFFFAILTPVGLLFRLMGRDVLAQRTKGSTWSPYPQRSRDHYEHLF